MKDGGQSFHERAAPVEGKVEDKGAGIVFWTSGTPILGTLEESS